jgi:hypothetical protein
MKSDQRKPGTRDTNKSNTSVLMSFFLIGLDNTPATIRAGGGLKIRKSVSPHTP